MKKIIGKVEFIPNYIWHILALGNIYNQKDWEYTEHYYKTVPAKDRNFIYQNREYIAWGCGRAGLLTWAFFFLPIKDKEISINEYLDFLNNLNYLIQNNESENLPVFEEHRDLFFNDKNAVKVFSEFISIFKNNLSVYHEEVWPKIMPELEKSKEILNNYLEEMNIIDKWEKYVKKDFISSNYEIILTFANKYLPSANDLSPHRENFYFQPGDEKKLVYFIAHEIGSILFKELLGQLYQSPELNQDIVIKNNLLWQAMESLSEYIKGILFNKRDIWNNEMFGGGKLIFPWFFEYYEKNISNHHFDEFKTLMRNAVIEFIKVNH